MRQVLRLVMAVVVGFVIGSVVNMLLIVVSGSVIPLQAGADVTTTEGLKASMHLFEPRHFIFPFLAHGPGAFVGALVAVVLTPGRTSGPACVVGFLFLPGGIANVVMLSSPLWFTCWISSRLACRQHGWRIGWPRAGWQRPRVLPDGQRGQVH